MTKYIVANENGDWWEFDSLLKQNDTVWVIESSKLKDILKVEDIYGLDKLERDIQEHGDPYSMTDIV